MLLINQTNQSDDHDLDLDGQHNNDRNVHKLLTFCYHSSIHLLMTKHCDGDDDVVQWDETWVSEQKV